MTATSGLFGRLLTFASSDTSYESNALHNLHPYPAKFIAPLPREIIREHTNERHCVLDPFNGSGTTLLEAALAGRRSVGIDSNPIACLVSRAKTTPLSDNDLASLEAHLKHVESIQRNHLPKGQRPKTKNLAHWFQENMIVELAGIRACIDYQLSGPSRQFAYAIFSAIITPVSNQDSETRYTAAEKDLPDGYALRRYVARLHSFLPSAAEYSELLPNERSVPRVIEASTDQVGSSDLKSNSADLVVTSPPYPNSFDYYLYHKHRMAWLGFDHQEVQRLEIGSRYEHSSRREPIETFSKRILPAMHVIARILKPSKMAYFFVGDSVIAGSHINMQDLYGELGERVGLELAAATSYDLAGVSRSFKDTRSSAGNSHKHAKEQRVLAFQNRKRSSSTRRDDPGGKSTTGREQQELSTSIAWGSVIGLRSSDTNRHVHALVGFPSKFVPAIPEWAIGQFSSPGDLVLDPFVGSGTTAVEATLAGRSALSVDVNPFAILATEAKTVSASPGQLDKDAAALFSHLEQPRTIPVAQRIEFELDDFWFDIRHLEMFAGLHALVEETCSKELLPFFRTVLGSTVRGFSYQDVGQIKVKRDPAKVLNGTPSPRQLFIERLPRAVEMLRSYLELRSDSHAQAIVGRAADVVRTLDPSGVDLVVTSPPYVNAMNYAMATRYEMVLLGLVDHETLRQHQQDYAGTERVYARDYATLHTVPSTWSCAEELNELLSRVYEHEPKRSYICYRYFMDMQRTLEEATRALKQGGRQVLVAGTNTIRGVPIDTFRFLASLMEDTGMEIEMNFHYEIVKRAFKLTRHKTANVIPLDGIAVARKQ